MNGVGDFLFNANGLPTPALVSEHPATNIASALSSPPAPSPPWGPSRSERNRVWHHSVLIATLDLVVILILIHVELVQVVIDRFVWLCGRPRGSLRS